MRVNWLAIVVSAIVFFLVGWLWYDVLFKAAWMNAVAAPGNNGGGAYPLVIALIASLCTAYAVARMIGWRGAHSAGHGAFIGASIGILVYAAPLWMDYAFAQRGIALGFIDAGYVIVGMAIEGAILGAWKPKAG